MADYPLLRLPAPVRRKVSGGGRGGGGIRFPDRQRQGERLRPVFERLRNALNPDHPLTFGEDPAGIAPERALVFEIADSVTGFRKAIAKVDGLEFLGDEDRESPADEDFGVIDTRKGRDGQIRSDKLVGGRLYIAMPDVRALRELLSFWDRHQAAEEAPFGYAPLWHVFDQLRALRAWGPEDRIPEDTVEFIEQRLQDSPDAVQRVEVELWSYTAREPRERALRRFREVLREAGGTMIHSASIPEVAYEAVLVDVPAKALRRMAQHRDVIAVCDDVMFVRPQSRVSFPTNVEETHVGSPTAPVREVAGPPVAALFDGVPVQRHVLLDRRLLIDDPDRLEDLSAVAGRRHGTAMASLILHGDRHRDEEPLDRQVYVRPVLVPMADGAREESSRDRLLVDTVYRAVRRMKEGDKEEAATAADVFLVNLSVGDRQRPFSGSISALARLLDYLSSKYGILFLVSAGNITSSLPLSAGESLFSFADASPAQRREMSLRALGRESARRTLLSPAEAMNVLTIGSWHGDAHSGSSEVPGYLLDPLGGGTGPNITSATGLGYRKVIKPEIMMHGGRELVRVTTSEDGPAAEPARPGRFFGLSAAAPSADGDLRQEAATSGTSAATALATRAACRLFEALMDEENGGVLAEADSAFYGPVVKALLVHRARWGAEAEDLMEIQGPPRPGGDVEMKDAISRLIGYGRPTVEEALTCAANRATLIGFGEIAADGVAADYRVPLPPSLSALARPRSVTCTLSWFTPVNVRHRMYRRAKLDLQAGRNLRTDDGFVERVRHQPAAASVRRGSLLHVRHEGARAASFVEDGHLHFTVICTTPAGSLDEPTRYGLAATVEAGEGVPVYAEIREGLEVRQRV